MPDLSLTINVNRNVAKIMNHPEFRNGSFFFDISVIKVVAPFDLTGQVGIIKLINSEYDPNGKVIKL